MTAIDDLYPLSPMQHGMLFHTVERPRSGVYLEQMVLELSPLAARAFRDAWVDVTRRHAVLRARCLWQEVARPHLLVESEVTLPWDEVDWSDLTREDQTERLQRYLADDRERGFDLAEAPLMRFLLARLGDNHYQVVWTHHHLLLDGWSVVLVMNDVLRLYEARRLGTAVDLPPPPPYASYIGWLRAQDVSRGAAFWREKLRGFDAPTRLGVSPSPDEDRPQAYHQERVRLERGVSSRLQQCARQHRLTISTFLYAAWAVLLARHSGERDLVFGITTAGRPAALPQAEAMIGLFINTLPLRCRLQESETALAHLRSIQAEQLEAHAYEHYPLAQIQAWSDVPRGQPLFQTLVVVENYPMIATSCADDSGGPHLAQMVRGISVFEHNHYPLTATAAPGDELLLTLTSDTSVFDPDRTRHLLGQWCRLLEAMTADPECPVSDLEIASAEERRQIIEDSRRARIEPIAPQCLHTLFERQAHRTPHAVAVVCEGRRVTYRELNARATRLAHQLIARGVRVEDVVALALPPSIETVIAILAVLQAGAAYLPLEPDHPPERLAFMLQDARAVCVITTSEIAPRLPVSSDLVIVDRSGLATGTSKASGVGPQASGIGREASGRTHSHRTRHAGGPTAGSAAYIIYTSGSTGQPKGVVVTHQNVVRLFGALDREFPSGASDVWTLFHSYAFDFSVWEIWGALLHGGRLVVVPHVITRAPAELLELLAREGVTVLSQTPSAFYQLIQVDRRDPVVSARLALRLVIFGGEALDLQRLSEWYRRHPDAPTLVNMYGITETTVHVTALALQPDAVDGEARSLIGVPIPDLQMYLLDGRFRPVPPGVIGEIYVAGPGLARGYQRRPALTAERFLVNPYGTPGERMYRSGDLARRLGDGTYEYLGRGDQQIKIRGFRVELGEIESALRQHHGVDDAVVIAQGHGAQRRLVAYVVADVAEADASELRTHLRHCLPGYMVPSVFQHVRALPLTSNGKLDRRALPIPAEPEHTAGTPTSTPHVREAPATSLQEGICRIWSDLLGTTQVGVTDNFFDLGGNSLLLLSMQQQLDTRMDVRISVIDLFKYPTVRALSEYLTHPSQPVGPEAAASSAAVSPASRDRAQSRIEALRTQRRRAAQEV